MTSSIPLQFDRDLLLAPIRIVFTSIGKLRLINTDPHNKKEKGLIPVITP